VVEVPGGGCCSSCAQYWLTGEVRAEATLVEGGKAVCLDARVGGDEKVRDEVQAWPAAARIA
jgi:hypothetical protein